MSFLIPREALIDFDSSFLDRILNPLCSSSAMRIVSSPPSSNKSANGWPRVIARNGIQLLDDWPFTFTNTTRVYFTENPDAPQGDIFRYRVGRLRVMLPNGRSRYLDIGNVSLL